MEYKFPQLQLNKPHDNKTTLIIVSSPIPTHPNTDLVDEAIESVMTMNYNFEDIIISYDCPPNKKHIASYEKYKSIMKHKYPKVKHLEMKEHGHFIGSFYNALSHTKSKYIMMLQHDIKLINKLPIDDLLKMKLNWNILATHHMKDGLKKTHWYPIIKKQNKYVEKTWGWSERIFLSKRDFFIDQIYKYHHNVTTKDFMDTIFYKEFSKLYRKTEDINKYDKINPSKEQMKKYTKFWSEWKCFNIKSEHCYHQHLHGRTSGSNKSNKTKKKGKMEGIYDVPNQGGYTAAKESAKANRKLTKYREPGPRTEYKIGRKEESTEKRGTHANLYDKFNEASDTDFNALTKPRQFKKVSDKLNADNFMLKKADPMKDKNNKSKSKKSKKKVPSAKLKRMVRRKRRKNTRKKYTK